MDLAGIASVLSPVSSIIGSLFGKKKAKAQGIDYEALRRDAEAAGFNPLTALMYGGSQGYERTFGPAMSRVQEISQAMGDFAQREFDRQAAHDRLSLDRDYFELERQRSDEERRSLGPVVAGVVHGPVFGPASRVAASGEPDGDFARYDLVNERYGPIPAALEGGGQYIIDAGRTVRGLVGDAMSALWHSVPTSRPAPKRRGVDFNLQYDFGD